MRQPVFRADEVAGTSHDVRLAFMRAGHAIDPFY